MAQNLSLVRVIIAETNPVVRSGLQAGLFGHGIRDVIVCKDAEQLRDALSREVIDLVICDVALPGSPFVWLAQEMRQYKTGRNPFALLVATLNEASAEEVNAGISGGADAMVKKPFPISAITERLQPMMQARRPFIATNDYVGPNRRKSKRPQERPLKAIDAPITLQEKAQGRVNPEHLQKVVDQGWAKLEKARAMNQMETLIGVIDRVLAFYDGHGTIDSHRRDLERLVSLSQQAAGNLRASSGTQTSTLPEIVKLIAKRPLAPHQSQLHMLAQIRKSATGKIVDAPTIN